MFQFKRTLVRTLFFALSFLVIIGSVEAAAVSFMVKSGKEETKTLNLSVEDHVLIKFNVVGSQEDNSLHFYFVCPNGTIRDFNRQGDFRYSFVCDLEGEYILRFSNVDSSVDKLVTLECEVEHYIFGLPQMLLLAVIIALVCVAAVATFVLMGKPR
ncbi:MAG: hypothetical protein QXK98_04910 [Candidatus Bathyarchaeia archaeon]